MGEISVAAPTDRHGYDLVRRLEQRLGQPRVARYDLQIELTLAEIAVGITPEQETRRYNVTGAAAYTLLAPDDDAFGAMGPAGSGLQQPENAAAMADILRDHILPGYVTVADIEAALKASNGEAVRMKTMGDTEVSFDREGDALVVTAADGARAKIEGSALTASNGVVIPLDAVLRKLP